MSAPATALTPTDPRRFTAKRAFFSFLGPEFRFFSAEGALLWFVKQKAFKLKEEITVFADEGRTKPALTIKARSVLDVRGVYDITDVRTGERVGSCKRQGFASLVRDTWEVRGPDDAVVGTLTEDSLALALVRRFLLKAWLPQTFTLTSADGRSLGGLKQRFNPFQLVYDADFGDAGLDARLGLAATVLLLAIEGRQG